MRIFVAYGYNPRDSWIDSVATPLIRAFGSEPIEGRELLGQIITDAVRQAIRNCDALIAFFTRRGDPIAPGTWNSHQWVRDELGVALENNKRVLEIYEDGVPREAGLAGRDRQYVTYREEQRVDCVVEVVKVLGQWHLRGSRRFQLVPNERIKPHLTRPYFRCNYNIMEGNNVTTREGVPVQRIQGGLFISVEGLSRDSLIQVEIVTDSGKLISDYTSIDAISLQVE